jgi:hypothetical protein
MKIVDRQSALACAMLLFLAPQAVAKRIPPNPVSPVVFDGIRYAAEGATDQYVVATDAKSGNVLWRLKIFHNRSYFCLYRDVQLVYITELKRADNALWIRDERSRCYYVDLTKKHVRSSGCASVFAP